MKCAKQDTGDVKFVSRTVHSFCLPHDVHNPMCPESNPKATRSVSRNEAIARTAVHFPTPRGTLNDLSPSSPVIASTVIICFPILMRTKHVPSSSSNVSAEYPFALMTTASSLVERTRIVCDVDDVVIKNCC